MLDKEKDHLLSVAALRGLAILLVITVHFSQAFPDISDLSRTLADSGARGVQLFFVLSAFTMCLSWAKGNDTAASFYIRRFFRIAPLFWLAIMAFILLRGGFGDPGLYSTALTVLFLHGFHVPSINIVIPGAWSIADEMIFYAVFPFIFLLWRKPVWCLGLIVGLGALCTAVYMPLVHGAQAYGFDQAVARGYFFLYFPNQLPAFLFGFLAYYVYAKDKYRAWTKPLVFWACLAVIILLPLAILGSQGCYIYEGVFAVLLLCLLRINKRIWVLKPLAWMGERSYSCYLLHVFILQFFTKISIGGGKSAMDMFYVLGHGDVGFVVGLPVFVLLIGTMSQLTYGAIEKPCMRFGSRLALSISCANRQKRVSVEY